MTKSKNEVATLEQFTISGNLDISDVLSVVTSKAEERYSAEIERCRAEIATLEEANTKLRTEIKKQAVKEAVEPHEENVKTLRTAVKVFGGTVSIVATERYHQKTLPTNDEGELTASVCVKAGKNNNHHYNTEFLMAVKPSKELQAKAKEVEDNTEKVRVLNVEAVSWKRKLNNVPMLERRYRAKIASTKLQDRTATRFHRPTQTLVFLDRRSGRRPDSKNHHSANKPASHRTSQH